MPQINNPLCSLLKGIKIAYLNINRIINKMHELPFIFSKYKFHIVFVAETWLNDSISNTFLNIDSYRVIRLDRSYNAGGGLLCFVHDNINVSIHSLASNVNIEYLNLIFHFPNKSKPLIVSAIYRKPSASDIFFEEFTSMLNSFSSFSKIYCLGDFNICSNLKNYPYSKLKSCCSKFDLKNLLSFPTHKQSCIDHIYANSLNISFTRFFGTMDISFSDHKLIYFTIKKNCKLPKFIKNDFSVRYDKNLLPDFIDILSSRLKSANITRLDANSKLCTFLDIFKNSSKIICGLKPKLPCRTSVNWITPEYMYIAYQRNKYYKRFNKTKDINTLLCYRVYRNKANNLAKKLKSQSFIKKLDCKSPKMFWSNIKQLLPLKCDSSKISLTKQVIKPSDNEFANFFANVANNLLNSNNVPYPDFTNNAYFTNGSLKFTFSTVDTSYILKLINKLPLKYSPDALGISSYLLKASNLIVAPFLTDIFNSFILSNSFPSIFKIAQLIPLFKSGDASNPSNYRPISILPNLSKIFEYILYDQINEYLSINNLISDYQFGFRKNHNTNFAITYLLNEIIDNLNQSKNVLAIFLDLAKAFDLVNHKLLLHKLMKYSFDINALTLMENYLNDRFFL
jgi:hypothetical protein